MKRALLLISLLIGNYSGLSAMNDGKVLRLIRPDEQGQCRSIDDYFDKVCEPCFDCCLETFKNFPDIVRVFTPHNISLLFRALSAPNPKHDTNEKEN